MRRWRIEDSAELYNISGWGLKYFSINDKGHVQVTPQEGLAAVDLKEVMDEKYVAFLLLESMYESGEINKATYENVLKEKRNYIEEKYNLKDVTV